MASNRDAVRDALNARRGSNGRFRARDAEEEVNLPDARDPRVPLDMRRLTESMDRELEEDDYEDDDLEDFDQNLYEDEQDEDDGWDGSTEPRKPAREERVSRDTRNRNPRGRREEPEEEDLDALRAEVAEARRLNALYQRTPDQLASILLQRMTPEQQQRVLQGIGGGAAQARVPVQPPLQIGNYQITAEEWADMTAAEKLAWENGHRMETYLPQQFERIEQEVRRSDLFRDFHTERTDAVIGVLAELLGIQIDAPDTTVIDRLLDQGYDMKTAVSEGYAKTLRKKLLATKKGRPRTPPNRPGGRDRLPPDASLAQIAAYVERHGRLPDE